MFEMIVNSVVSGVFVGGFYASLAIGLSIAFGMLNITFVAHPAFILLGAYLVYLLNATTGLDPLIAGLLLTPVFFLAGMGLYTAYYNIFEKRGAESLRGLVFFFGIIMLIEISLTLCFGVDFRMVRSAWITKTFSIGFLGIALRLLIPFIVSIVLIVVMHLFFSKTYIGMISRGVAQDSLAVRLMGADPVRVKRLSFAIALSTAAIAGAMFIAIMPIEPSLGTAFISRVFPIVVLAGLGSIKGTLISAVIIGIAENLTSTLAGPSWALAVSFGILLLVLTLKPSGLFRR